MKTFPELRFHSETFLIPSSPTTFLSLPRPLCGLLKPAARAFRKRQGSSVRRLLARMTTATPEMLPVGPRQRRATVLCITAAPQARLQNGRRPQPALPSRHARPVGLPARAALCPAPCSALGIAPRATSQPQRSTTAARS